MTKENFERYASLKTQITALEKELEEVKPLVLSDMNTMQEANEQDIVISLPGAGSFSWLKRRTYAYPDWLVAEEASVRDKKKRSEADGTATYTEARHIRFDALKA